MKSIRVLAASGAALAIALACPHLAAGKPSPLGPQDKPQERPEQRVKLAQNGASDAAPSLFESDTVYLEADELIDDQEGGRYIARGNVEARQRGRVMRADEVIYYPRQNRLTASGNVILIEPNGTMEFVDSAEFSDDLSQGVALDFAIRLPNNAMAAAAYAERVDDGARNILTRAVYSACEVCEDNRTPTWRMRARKAIQDTEEDMIYYRDVTFEVEGVPVFYSPFFAHADPSVERRTGLLIPDIGYSTITGFRYQQPIFWAINESQDLTLSPVLMTGVNPLLGYNYRKRFYSGYVEFDGTLTKEQLFDSDGDTFGESELRGSLFGSGVFRLTEDWDWGFGVEHVSDDQYLQRYDIEDSNQRRGLYRGEGRRLMSQIFLAGQSETFYSSVTAADFQGLRAQDQEGLLPRLLPIAEYRRFLDFDSFGRVELLGDLTMLQRDEGVDYARATFWADWRSRHVTNSGIVFEPFGRARGDFYRINDAFDPYTGLETDGGAERASGYAGVDIRWPFYRPGRIDLTLEPRAQIMGSVGQSYVLEDFASGFIGGTPVPLQEDSFTVELNGSNLFSPDRYPGFDIMEEGLRANIGGRLHANWANRGSATLFVGQSYHEDPENFPASSGLSDTWSDYVVEGDVRGRWGGVATRLRIDPDDFEVQRLELEGLVRWNRFSVRGNYLNLDETFTGSLARDYVTAAATMRITDNVSVGYGIARDLENSRTQRQTYSLIYQDDCLLFTIEYLDDNRIDRVIGPSGTVLFRFALKTLGAFGTQ